MAEPALCDIVLRSAPRLMRCAALILVSLAFNHVIVTLAWHQKSETILS